MTRQLLAFLALLSGLAAIGGPAQASLAEAMACDRSVSASAEAPTESGAVQAQPRAKPAKSDPAIEQAERGAPAFGDLRLPVLMGIDRAYE